MREPPSGKWRAHPSKIEVNVAHEVHPALSLRVAVVRFFGI